MVVIPFEYVEPISKQWWRFVKQNLSLIDEPPVIGVEWKSADMYDIYRRIRGNGTLRLDQLRFLQQRTPPLVEIEAWIKGTWDFISGLPPEVIFLSSVVKKQEYWLRYCDRDYKTFRIIKKHGMEHELKRYHQLRTHLKNDVQKKAFKWLLQRLHYLMEDKNNSETIVIGDEMTDPGQLKECQCYMQAGYERYTSGKNIVNNVVFGSSIYNPPIQIADWLAFAVRNWAIQARHTKERLGDIIHQFRDYPNVAGRGIVLIPNPHRFPNLPL